MYICGLLHVQVETAQQEARRLQGEVQARELEVQAAVAHPSAAEAHLRVGPTSVHLHAQSPCHRFVSVWVCTLDHTFTVMSGSLDIAD